jgi:hypothetical protein
MEENNHAAGELLSLLAYLAPDEIPPSLFARRRTDPSTWRATA